MHYVILGNGVAGMEAALALRARDDEARITLVSAEHDHFFSRPALMYVFAGQTTPPRHRALRPAASTSGCASSGVSGRVAALDAPGTRSSSRTARASAYDRLLLAVGLARAARRRGREPRGRGCTTS